jgi:uncharacterized protein YndB with AHSA1/START domain
VMPWPPSKLLLKTNHNRELMMQNPEQSQAVQKTVIVNTEPERAFAAFTDNMAKWWPKEHHIGGTPFFAIIVEPRAGGRWYEKGEDGSECDWGTVLCYEAPHRVVFSWHLNGDFEFVSEIAKASEVEIRFIPEGVEKTRVELEHRHFERHGESSERLRTAVDKPEGWTLVLSGYERLVAELAGKTPS